MYGRCPFVKTKPERHTVLFRFSLQFVPKHFLIIYEIKDDQFCVLSSHSFQLNKTLYKQNQTFFDVYRSSGIAHVAQVVHIIKIKLYLS